MKIITTMCVLLPLLLAFILFAGCTSPAPGNQVSPVSLPATTITTPAITPGVTIQQTDLPANPVPEETPVPVEAYIKRPYGFIKYEYNPAHKVRLLESHVETDPTGARTVVGTIKNIGLVRIDLVTVTITLFNADGNAIGSASSEVNYLEPNKVWKFRTSPITMSDFKSHQVAEIFTG